MAMEMGREGGFWWVTALETELVANLTSTYRNKGRWKKAGELEVMETRKRVLGKEYPDMLTSMNNLTFILKGHGQDSGSYQSKWRNFYSWGR